MWLINKIIEASVKNRLFVAVGVLAFVALGAWGVTQTRFDAFPDITKTQVQVVTASPGMASEETELLVTLPIERELGGIPEVREMRSLSRTGISSIVIIFEDGVDMWHARQMVKEKLDAARSVIPKEAGTPQLGPPATGLGEVFQFTVSSERHTGAELDRIFRRDIAPRLLTAEGVVEVNAWGGGAAQLDVEVDPFALAARDLSIEDVRDALARAVGLQSGGSIVTGPERILVRAVANPTEPEELEAVRIRGGDAPIALGDVAEVYDSKAMTVGFGSAQAEGEVMFAVAQLLRGADALGAVEQLRDHMDEVRESLPEGVEVDVIYDRGKLVGNTLDTVSRSLIEGGALVILVLLLMLGDVRSGLLVASVIPLSMLGAFLGLNALGYSGNLMSLGAIDFGLIVDGSIVVAESIVALEMVRQANKKERIIEQTQSVAKPVFFAVGVLFLVYIPIMTMTGTEGKLFRPMALTVLLALGTALVLSFTYVPAIASWIVEPKGEKHTWLVRKLEAIYQPTLDYTIKKPLLPVVAAIAVLVLSVVLALDSGTEFVPQLQEGDIVVQTARVPSISAEQALEEATRIERIIGEFQPVERVASRTGAPGVATDPMGLEESDIFVQLKPRAQWQGFESQPEIVASISSRLEAADLGTELTFTQPIEMRFNEMLEGITSDVGVKVYGPNLDEILRISQEVAEKLEAIDGAADVAPPTIEGQPSYEVDLDPSKLALYSLDARAVMDVVAGVRRGTPIGSIQRGQFRDPIVVKLDYDEDEPLGALPISLPGGGSVPLSSIADVTHTTTPSIIERDSGSRRYIVEANVRGRDIGGFVQDARASVADIDLPDGYWIEWSGKYEQLQSAAQRTALTVPVVLFLILGVLYVAFRNWRIALLIFLNVPVAASGGLITLYLRGLPISMSAIVGLIALFGIAVMNGFVMLNRTREIQREHGAEVAARRSAKERFRPVLMTAMVAGIGFLPMALQAGVGAEVQRPLATVVIGGLITSTLLTLVVIPSLYAKFIPDELDEEATDHV